MFMATVFFSTKISGAKETYLISNTIEGINNKLERFKTVLGKNNLSFCGHIIEERPELGETNKLQEEALIASGLDFIANDDTIIQ